MAKAGDFFVIELKQAHLEWGEHRYTGSRGVVYGEGYIPIHSDDAYRLNIRNQNGTGYRDIWGVNLFNCVSSDGMLKCVLRAQGNQSDNRYAKQFSGDNDLKAIGTWYNQIGAQVGDLLRVSWVNETDIIIEKM